MPLLAQSVKEDPYDDRNAFYYARELFFYGQYEQSVEEFKRHLSLPRALWRAERAASMRYIAKMSEKEEQKAWILKAMEEDPGRREPIVDMAKHCYENKLWEETLKYSEMAMAVTEKPLDYLCEEFAWGSAPWDYAAIAAYNLGMLDKAMQYGTKAVELNPNDPRLLANLAFYSKE
jgi:tetratricopeptide (TPR) repeat protein